MRDYADSVVKVLKVSENGERRVLGSGFVCADGSLIVTCRHVLEGDTSGAHAEENIFGYEITLPDGAAYAATRVAATAAADSVDIAFLRVASAISCNPLAISSSRSLVIDQPLQSFGFPNIDAAAARASVRFIGAIPYLNTTPRSERLGPYRELQLASDELTEGFSGAPVWDPQRGAVVGITQSVLKPDLLGKLGRTAYAVPSDMLPFLIAELRLLDTIMPYVGLRPFKEAEHDIFFGRNGEIQELMNLVRSFPRLIVLSGPSGSGKSSLLRAGVGARLRAANGDSVLRSIYPIVFRPRDNPSEQLRLETGESTVQGIAEGPMKAAGRDHMLLAIDQAEELLTPQISRSFISEINECVAHCANITILLAIRSDYTARMLELLRAGPGGSITCEVVTLKVEMSREALGDIIACPARNAGSPWPDDFVYLMIAACGAYRKRQYLALTAARSTVGSAAHPNVRTSSEATILPLVQFTLDEIWRRRQQDSDSAKPPSHYYEDLGGLSGSVSENATRYYNSRNPETKLCIERILLDLVYISQPEPGVIVTIRRSRRVDQLRVMADTPTRAKSEQVLAHLIGHALVSSTGGTGTERVVELVHDSLATNWELLNIWVSTNAQSLLVRQDIERARSAWIADLKRSRALAPPDMLRRVADAGLELDQWLSPQDHGYLSKSRRYNHRWWYVAAVLLLLIVAAPPLVSYHSPDSVPALAAITPLHRVLDNAAPFVPTNADIARAAGDSQGILSAALLAEARLAKTEYSCERAPWKFYYWKAKIEYDKCQLSVWDTSQALFALTMSSRVSDLDVESLVLPLLQNALNSDPNHAVYHGKSLVGWPTSRDTVKPKTPTIKVDGQDVTIAIGGGALMSYTDASPTFWSEALVNAIPGYRPDLIARDEITNARKWIETIDQSLFVNGERLRAPDNRQKWARYSAVLDELSPENAKTVTYSAYATTMALFALLHNYAPCTGAVTWSRPDSLVTGRVREIVRWFDQPEAFNSDDDYWAISGELRGGDPDALGFQIAAELLMAERYGIPLSDHQLATVDRLLQRGFAYSIHTWGTPTDLERHDASTHQAHITSTDGAADENTDFSWYPWAVTTAALWYDRSLHAHAGQWNAEANRARRYLGRLMDLSDLAKTEALKDRSYKKAELSYALSVVENVVRRAELSGSTAWSPSAIGPINGRCMGAARRAL